mgnify:FL=1
MQRSDRISFIDQLLDAVEAFMLDYEQEHGGLPGPLERGLFVSYSLGVMRSNVDALWEMLAASSVFGAANPRALFEEQAGGVDDDLRSEAQAALVARGWVPPGGE